MTVVDSATRDEWYTIGSPEDIVRRGSFETGLLGQTLQVSAIDPDNITVTLKSGSALPVKSHIGLIWTSVGNPPEQLFEVPEYHLPNRLNMHAFSSPQRVSALRLVESVADPARFPFLHPGLLGDEEHAALKPFGETIIDENGHFWSFGHFSWSLFTNREEEMTYQMVSPTGVLLRMRQPDDPHGKPQWNVIALFGQPVDEENCIAHKWYSWKREDWMTVTGMRSDALFVATQVKRVITTHQPQKVPLYEGAECLMPCDSAIAGYRDWLKSKGVTYGVNLAPDTDIREDGDTSWYPVATLTDVPYGHLYSATLSGRPLVVWRDDKDQIHVWHDRCPHRGEKLSIGRHRKDRIQTNFHGWEFDTLGRCCFVPAHPDLPLPDCSVRVYSHKVEHGLIWARLSEAEGACTTLDAPGDAVALRPITIRASADRIKDALAAETEVVCAVRPVNDRKSVVYGLANIPVEKRIEGLRHYDRLLKSVRIALEAQEIE